MAVVVMVLGDGLA